MRSTLSPLAEYTELCERCLRYVRPDNIVIVDKNWQWCEACFVHEFGGG